MMVIMEINTITKMEKGMIKKNKTMVIKINSGFK